MKKLLLAIAATSALSIPAISQAETPPKFLGEIITFTGNYCPEDTLEANGQLLEITRNNALYSILGTTYGGDGKTTFALPNLTGQESESGKPKLKYCVITGNGGWFPLHPRR